VKVLHLVTTLDVGGAEMHLLQQVRGQHARGVAPTVAYLKGEGALRADFEAAGARVERLGGPAWPLRLASLMRDADVVHTHLLKADAAGAIVATLCGARSKLVASKHNDERALLSPLVSLAHGILGNLPKRTIVLSDHVGRFIAHHGRVAPRRIVRVYYGLDTTAFERAKARRAEHRARLRAELGATEADHVAICIARFAPQKAHDVLLSAFARAREREPRLKLWLAGDDPFGDGRSRAEALARELRLGDAVRFLGIRRDIPELLCAADSFTMASLWEGLGLVFLEAMTMGLPIASTNVSAIPEVVLEGRTGVLVPPGDPGALAAARVRIASDAELARSAASTGPAWVAERFSIDRMVDETLAVYEQALGVHLAPSAGR
jgi:glycosyltransferase involved in cell wall biosynthesis